MPGLEDLFTNCAALLNLMSEEEVYYLWTSKCVPAKATFKLVREHEGSECPEHHQYSGISDPVWSKPQGIFQFHNPKLLLLACAWALPVRLSLGTGRGSVGTGWYENKVKSPRPTGRAMVRWHSCRSLGTHTVKLNCLFAKWK